MGSLFSTLKYVDRVSFAERALDDVQRERLRQLREEGYVVLENFISPDLLSEIKREYRKRLEEDCLFELPCLAQSRIDRAKHHEVIKNHFLFNNEDLRNRGLTFDRGDFSDYQDAISRYAPSTLKLYLSNIQSLFPVWLNSQIVHLVESFMHVTPFLAEAYIRRNYPAQYKVMNHYWHRDKNNPDFVVKAFFFLSDCTPLNGPHEYIAGSAPDNRFTKKSYYTDEEIAAVFPHTSDKRKISIVQAGTVIIENTKGLHRACMPREGFRDLGYAVFVPKPFYRRQKFSNYSISQSTYDQLDAAQKAYIPTSSIK